MTTAVRCLRVAAAAVGVAWGCYRIRHRLRHIEVDLVMTGTHPLGHETRVGRLVEFGGLESDEEGIEGARVMLGGESRDEA